MGILGVKEDEKFCGTVDRVPKLLTSKLTVERKSTTARGVDTSKPGTEAVRRDRAPRSKDGVPLGGINESEKISGPSIVSYDVRKLR